VAALFSSLTEAVRAFRAVFGNPDLRRVELAFVGFNAAELGTWIAILVFAYEVGGAAAAGAIGVIQLVPATIFAPFASLLGDRYRRERVLLAGYLTQALSMGMTAVALMVEAPIAVVYALAALAATSVTLTRPAQGSLLPSLARSPEELTAANAAVGWIESLSMFGGPAVAGVLLALSGPGAVFAAMSGALLVSAFLTARIEVRSAPAEPMQDGSPLGDLLGGFRALVRERRPRLVVLLMGSYAVVEGALDVMLVVLAIKMLQIGSGGVGFLNAAVGVGGVLGAALTTLLVARRRLTPPLIGGAAALGTALLAIGLFPSRVLAPVFVGVAGAGRPMIDVAGRTMLQRVVPDRVLSRVFGVLEGFYMAGLAIGLTVTPILFYFLGERATFVVVGAFLPGVYLLAWRRLIGIDASVVIPEARLALLRSLPIFAPLSAPSLEQVASRLIPIEVPSGTEIVRQDDPGDRFYIIESGGVTVSKNGRRVATLEGGDFFGEIALLREIPRTATVTAQTDTRLYALERDDFLEAVTGHPHSAEAADAVTRARLADR
jgi:MFS family permease